MAIWGIMTSAGGIGSGDNANIADEHAIVLAGLKATFETPAPIDGPEITVVAELGNGINAVTRH